MTDARALDTEFVVVGGGVMGLSTAWSLARSGRDVAVLEQFEVGHAFGSSHGASRVYRTFYDRLQYSAMARKSLPLWREFESESGKPLLEVTGSIQTLAGSEQDRQTLDEIGIAYEVLDEREARARFPDVHVPGAVIHQRDTGVVSADRTLRALKEALGPRLREGVRVRSVDVNADSVVVRTDPADIRASVVVLCCGSYAPELTASLGIAVPLLPTREHVAYFRHRSGELPDELPVFIDGTDVPRYGLPTRSLGLYKLAEHGTGPHIDPRDARTDTDPAVVERLADAARTYLPGFDPQPVGAETCIYENTPDRHFVMDRRGRIVVGTGFSGHGFKFAPLIGDILAALATDADPDTDLSLFSLDREALHSGTAELTRPR